MEPRSASGFSFCWAVLASRRYSGDSSSAATDFLPPTTSVAAESLVQFFASAVVTGQKSCVGGESECERKSCDAPKSKFLDQERNFYGRGGIAYAAVLNKWL